MSAFEQVLAESFSLSVAIKIFAVAFVNLFLIFIELEKMCYENKPFTLYQKFLILLLVAVMPMVFWYVTGGVMYLFCRL